MVAEWSCGVLLAMEAVVVVTVFRMGNPVGCFVAAWLKVALLVRGLLNVVAVLRMLHCVKTALCKVECAVVYGCTLNGPTSSAGRVWVRRLLKSCAWGSMFV